MSNYNATIKWQRNDQDFVNKKYSRAHEWLFDGGAVVSASASPHIVPLPWSVESNVDPEEAFIASVSSCHMLFYLDIAASRGIQVDSYTDNAIGEMKKNQNGKLVVSRIILNPDVQHSGENLPDQDTLRAIHHEAHAECFIANSIKTEVVTNL
jgi:organic hydroperoxide reductase OsmC/OhrA